MTLVLAEFILRIAGYAPHNSAPRWPNVPISKQPDVVLGWKQKPGRYVYKAFVEGLPDIRMTISEDGTRTTGTSDAKSHNGLAIFGCSYAEGEHISDEDTFAWKLQSRYPEIRVTNYGVAGYGTYQSRLLMEKVLERPNPPHKLLYAFMEHHEARNIAHSSWLKGLSGHSTEGDVALPFASLDASGRLLKHEQRKYPQWPLSGHLATVAFAQDLYVRLEARRRESQEVPVTMELIREMKEMATERGVEFAAVLLYGLKPEGKLEYINYFRKYGIEHYDCEYPKTPDHVVPGEGHPNGKLNTLWAACIAQSLEADGNMTWTKRQHQEAKQSLISHATEGAR
jgi:hypothetical protein